MNVRLLKAKRVEKNLYQKDLAKALNITEKAMSQKECSPVNKFKADEMVTIAKTLNLSFSEFDAIFFDHQLTECLRRQQKVSCFCRGLCCGSCGCCCLFVCRFGCYLSRWHFLFWLALRADGPEHDDQNVNRQKGNNTHDDIMDVFAHLILHLFLYPL